MFCAPDNSLAAKPETAGVAIQAQDARAHSNCTTTLNVDAIRLGPGRNGSSMETAGNDLELNSLRLQAEKIFQDRSSVRMFIEQLGMKLHGIERERSVLHRLNF